MDVFRRRVSDSAQDWVRVGQRVKHRYFGTGVIVQVQQPPPLKSGKKSSRMPHVWVQLDVGRVAELGLPADHSALRPRRWFDITTRRRRTIRCDVCGGHPVVVTGTHVAVGAPSMTAQRCMDHQDNLDVMENTLPADRV
jgi:hypothetical protein